MNRALLVVDVQNDFCEGGRLPVGGGLDVAAGIGEYIKNWGDQYAEIVFTLDWHNRLPDTNGGHFAVSSEPDYVNTWPVHCEAYSPGAYLRTELTYGGAHLLGDGEDNCFYKGQGKPDYSGFQGVNTAGTDLNNWLLEHDIEEVDVIGIAGDFCVLQTALDAQRLGFNPRILPEYVASVGGTKATLEAIATLESA